MNEFLRKKLVEDLYEEGIDDNSIKYIQETIKYLDSNVEKSLKVVKVPKQMKSKYMYAYLNIILDITKKIKQHKTGILEIDQHESFSYEDAYISIIAKNGGMYSYVLKTYEEELKIKKEPKRHVY